MQYNLKSIFVRYIPNVVQLKFSLHLTPTHVSIFSDRLIIFQTHQFKEITKDTFKLLNKTIMIWSCKAEPCIHGYNYLVFPFHFLLCKIIIASAKCAVKISFSYQKNIGGNSSLLCIKLFFLIRLFCSLFGLLD